MARVQFELPDHFIFTTEVQIYVSHVNQAGHLDNAQLLTLVSEGRARFFRWLGYTEFDVEGVAIVVGDMLAQYKSEGFYGEVIRVEMVPADFNKYSFDLVFRLTEVSYDVQKSLVRSLQTKADLLRSLARSGRDLVDSWHGGA